MGTTAEIDGETNPTLQLRAGEIYTITWTNVDGAPHSLLIADAAGSVIESTEIVEEEGQTQSLEFEATEDMNTYYCEVHPDSMRGEIAIGNVADDATGTGEAQPITEAFTAGQLAGDQGPAVVETSASGAALFGLGEGGDQLHYLLLVAEIERVTQAHIHLGGADEDGDVVAWLFGLQDEQDAFVSPLEGSSLEDLLEQLRAESAYVNVHTEQNPGGEIRGQIGSTESVSVELAERVNVAADETLRMETQVTLNVSEPGGDRAESEEMSEPQTDGADCHDGDDDDHVEDGHTEDDDGEDNDDHGGDDHGEDEKEDDY
ncbi:CHRD domain-containing protein [Halomontanus rarus]|uniref:CHRD domain-containing protein n=1 Tax=Halomontanus rarus TaxID=3034020 RepID=UPI0023E79EB0|nr:CHRD domain-containing protein [Halovivax sp. TS33]